jgi:type IV secretory pathway ATPase VirB11/archaellum biosynthesis ATPase
MEGELDESIMQLDESMMSPGQRTARRIVQSVVEPILGWVERPEVSEIAMNRPEEVWLKLRKPDENGNIWVRRKDGRLDRGMMEAVLHVLANAGNTPNYGPAGQPVCYGTLPGGHRFCGAYGPNFQYYTGENDVEGTVVFVCRQYSPGRRISFEDYGLKRGVELQPFELLASRKSDGSDPITRILASIKRGDHMLISGGTDTGKTTFMNDMLRRVNPRFRILTVQDTPEINVLQPNHYHMLLARQGQPNKFDYRGVVDLIVRSTPDIVVAGEISTTNAAAIWELMRAGSGSFMTTIHAEEAKEAISTFMTRISHTSPQEVADRDRVRSEMLEKLRIVQITKDSRTNERRIVQVN